MKRECPFFMNRLQEDSLSKTALRKRAREKRKSLPLERRLPAASKLVEILLPRLQGSTLSFASFADEIDLWPLNDLLCKKGLLLLPGQDHTQLTVFAVEDLSQLEKTRKGLCVPKEDVCRPVPLANIAFVLVPALAFDEKGGRIGYGGGFYDRLLAKLQPETQKIGVGFIEQLFTQELPHEAHDIYVDELVLV